MNQQKTEKLKAVIKKGRWSYIVKHGVLGWGLGTAILWSVIMHFIDSMPFTESIFIALVIFPICGFFLGLFNWFLINREFSKLEKG